MVINQRTCTKEHIGMCIRLLHEEVGVCDYREERYNFHMSMLLVYTISMLERMLERCYLNEGGACRKYNWKNIIFLSKNERMLTVGLLLRLKNSLLQSPLTSDVSLKISLQGIDCQKCYYLFRDIAEYIDLDYRDTLELVEIVHDIFRNGDIEDTFHYIAWDEMSKLRTRIMCEDYDDEE